MYESAELPSERGMLVGLEGSLVEALPHLPTLVGRNRLETIDRSVGELDIALQLKHFLANMVNGAKLVG